MKCIFCGKPAGLLKREHPECRATAEKGKKYLSDCIDYIYNARDCMNIAEVIAQTVSEYNIPETISRQFFLECWNAKVLSAFEDGILDIDEIKVLMEMLDALNISNDDLSNSEQWNQLVAYGKSYILKMIDTATRRKDFSNLQMQIDTIANLYGFSKETVMLYALEYWKNFTDKALENGILSKENEDLIIGLDRFFGFSDSDTNEYNTKLTKGAILREISEGILPNRVHLPEGDSFPIPFQKNETIVWATPKSYAFEERNRTRNGIQSVETLSWGSGIFVITNKNIYWASARRSIKLPIKKVVSIIRYSDGITIQKDGVTARPLSVQVDDPKFYYTLLSNLNRIS